MTSEFKKPYTAPKLTIHGDVEKITQQGGVIQTDVPQGTPVTGPGSVTGS